MLSRARSVEEDTSKKGEEKLINMIDNRLFNKNCLKKMVQTLMGSQDLDLARRAHNILLEVLKWRQRAPAGSENCNKKLAAHGTGSLFGQMS